MISHEPVITVDGASGTGKGTVSQLLAKRLHWRFLDSGALYRSLAYAAQKQKIDLNDENKLATLAKQHLNLQFIAREYDLPKIILDSEDITEVIRTEKIGNDASIIAAFPTVRAALINKQRAFRESPGLVADGRDMGTIIFPDADLKIFLTASSEERALRRYSQLKQKGINVTLGDLIEELKNRDKRDQERPVAPLKPAEDAICIDTDKLTVEQVVDQIIVEIKRKKAFPAIPYTRIDLGMGVAE